MSSSMNPTDVIKQCIKDALDATDDIRAPDYRIEAFKISFAKLLERRLGTSNLDPVSTKSVAAHSIPELEPDLLIITPTGSAIDNLRELFKSEWGNKRRTVDDIRKALDTNNVPDKYLTQNLSRLVDYGELRCIKINDQLVYWRNPDYKPE